MTNVDKLFDNLFGTFLASSVKELNAYPPYNVIRVSETETVLEYAVAGFNEKQITVEVENNILKITGTKDTSDIANYLYKGVATRSFEKRFSLHKNSEVTKAEYADGMLSIHIKSVTPESNKSLIPIVKGQRTYLTERDDIV
jgi:molecular chaperone IbpA